MKINIQAVHFNADQKLLDYVKVKLQNLDKYQKNITGANVFLKIDNMGHMVKDKVAEVQIHIPQHRFFAKSKSLKFEDAYDDVIDAIIYQLKKYKEKKRA